MPSWRQLRLWCHILSVLTHTPVQATCPAWSHFRRPTSGFFLGRWVGLVLSQKHGTLFLNLHCTPERYSPLLPWTVASLLEALFHREEMTEKSLSLPSLEERRGKMENLPRKDGVGNTEIVLPEKLWGWCYPQASEDALWVSSANHCRTETSNCILQMLRTGTGVGENQS